MATGKSAHQDQLTPQQTRLPANWYDTSAYLCDAIYQILAQLMASDRVCSYQTTDKWSVYIRGDTVVHAKQKAGDDATKRTHLGVLCLFVECTLMCLEVGGRLNAMTIPF